ncbi:MAG: EAL domain-containing protein [Ruminococcus sp.]|nr:EAL domain-containing protein [Ruminococcus sp.]
MAERRKRIAIYVGQADESYQSRFITGYLKTAFSQDTDVCVFSMYKKYQDTAERERGEANIFFLPEPGMFDGAVILSDTIQTAGVAQRLEERLYKNFRKPVLIIEQDSKLFKSLFTDGYSAVVELVSHLIEVHGFKDIAFLSGKKWHKHSIQRQKAYTDAMEQHGLKVSKDRIIHGDFWYQSGEFCAEKLLSGGKLPEAVVCANDPMAIGLCKALEANGVRIPEDIAVVSYDSSFEGQTAPKSITSSLIPAEELGSYAAEYMENTLRGRETAPFNVKSSLLIGESCGCKNCTMPSYSLKRKEWGTVISEEGFDSINNTMADSLMSVNSLSDFLGAVYSYAYQIPGAESFHLCLCSPWKYMEQNSELRVSNSGYTDRMLYAVRYNSDRMDGLAGTDKDFSRSELLPDLNAERSYPTAFFFTPVFCGDQCFGYAAVNYGKEARSYDDIFRRWIGLVSRSFEALWRQFALQNLRDKLNKMKNSKFAAAGAAYESLSDEEKADYGLVSHILDDNLLKYYFQPIVNTVDGAIYSFEALMRSDTEKKIAPLSIIKYSDMQNRLADVEKATFFNVLDIVEKNKELLGSIKIFVNSIPGIRMEGEDFERLVDCLKKHSDNVVVELTEGAELDDRELERMKNIFRMTGNEIAVDDYGTGYSNVSNLIRYMPNYVKIDRALLSDIPNDPQKQHFVREIIGFCHDNGIKALAEGVETYEEMRSVILLGVDLIQGFYTGRPAPEFIDSIDGRVRAEIETCHRESQLGSDHKYIAGKTNRVSLAALVKDGCTEIVVGHGTMVYKDIAVIGAPNIRSDIHIKIEAGYVGRITLENVYLTNNPGHPCIDIGGNADVTLLIEGENFMRNSGIRVPPTSRLTLEGTGNMSIELYYPEFYGIGNDVGSVHGDLILQPSGLVQILGRGASGVCIGSGLGGIIKINSGQYILETNSETGVAIGAITGSAQAEIRKSNVSIEFAATNGIGIGSVSGSARMLLSNSAFMLYGSGNDVAGIGTLGSSLASAEIFESSPIMNISANCCTSIGSFGGRTEIKAVSSVMKFETSGDDAIAIGGFNDDADIELRNSDIRWSVHNKTGRDICMARSDIRNIGGRERFVLNDTEIKR